MTTNGCSRIRVIRKPLISPINVPADQDDQDGQRPGQIVGHEKVDEDHAEQREHRSDRQVDAAGNDHEAFAEREQSEQSDQIGGVGQVDRETESAD